MSGGGRTSEGQPHRVAPAAPAERVAWPDAFGTRFTVFVDVEEEFDWTAPLDRANRGTTAMAGFADAHRRFADRGVGLTCMVDHPIAVDPTAVAILRRCLEDGRSAIGAQLHPWVNPPFAEAMTPANSYAGNLPAALEAAKLDALTAAIAAAFGAAPQVYRAGRYGIGPHTLPLLAARGYRIDTSMRACYDYRGDGGPDLRAIGAHAFRREGVIELPLTTVFTGAARGAGAWAYPALARVPRGRGIAARAGMLARVALTPEDMPADDVVRAIDAAIADGTRLLTFAFHSPSLVPGHTPYVRDAADLAAFWQWWEVILAHLDRRGIRPATIAEIIAAA